MSEQVLTTKVDISDAVKGLKKIDQRALNIARRSHVKATAHGKKIARKLAPVRTGFLKKEIRVKNEPKRRTFRNISYLTSFAPYSIHLEGKRRYARGGRKGQIISYMEPTRDEMKNFFLNEFRRRFAFLK